MLVVVVVVSPITSILTLIRSRNRPECLLMESSEPRAWPVLRNVSSVVRIVCRVSITLQYFSVYQMKSRTVRSVGHVVYFEVVEVRVEFYSGRPSENTPREGPSRRLQNDAKIDLKETSYKGVDWFCEPGMRTNECSCVHDNESLESVNVRISWPFKRLLACQRNCAALTW
jgi:hypothetical protein